MLMMQPVPDPKEGHTLGNPDCCCGLCEPGPKRKLIASFTANGKPHHMFRDSKTGYCPWALNCTCKLCADDRINAWKGSMDHNGSKPGKTTKIDAVEATLNWQTENAIAQSRALKKLDSKVSYMDSKVSTVEEKLDDNFKMRNGYSRTRFLFPYHTKG
ncbi:polyprotein [Gossypium arboreum]|uniref:Polyprotein n=1 Tax=Gossypium arboreum TaxID=29729 RepID=A0A0B0MY05_GOSAR|nr:polyprotein [Gossypium arboreum]